jgi:hypothetical protein
MRSVPTTDAFSSRSFTFKFQKIHQKIHQDSSDCRIEVVGKIGPVYRRALFFKNSRALFFKNNDLPEIKKILFERLKPDAIRMGNNR